MIDFTEWADLSFAIKFHVVVALIGLGVGTVIMIGRRGTRLHRWLGRGFSVAALATALSSFFIHEINQWGQWSWIHLLSVYTIVAVVIGFVAIRRGNVKLHMQTMIPVYLGGFIVAGAFTLLPGRTNFEMLLEPTFEAVFANDWALIELTAWVFPLIGSAIALFVGVRTLVIPLRRKRSSAERRIGGLSGQ